jgi:hypothetical protein
MRKEIRVDKKGHKEFALVQGAIPEPLNPYPANVENRVSS